MNKTKRISFLGLLIAIEVILVFTPLGYIPIGPLRATTLHIPVIFAGIAFGVKEGALLGFIFGLSSLIINTISPTITSFVFSPFITIGENSGNFASVFIAFGPRILIGVVSGTAFRFLLNKFKNENVAVIISSLLGALVNTLFVLFLIYLFFGKVYASSINISYSILIRYLFGIITTNGILEAVVGAIIVLAIYKALHKQIKKLSR